MALHHLAESKRCDGPAVTVSYGSLASQAEKDSESTVNVVEFVARQQTVRLPQAAGVYRANRFDQHTSSGTFDLNFWPEGGGKGLSRRRGDHNGGQG